MKLNDYQVCATRTAAFPESAKVAYPALGLIGEIVELNHAITTNSREDIVKEAGDVLWYCAILTNDLDLELSECVDATDFAFVSSRYEPNMLGLCGRIAEAAKKYVRDDNLAKRETIRASIGRVLQHVRALSKMSGVPIDRIAEENLQKLESRMARGVIKGDGDNR